LDESTLAHLQTWKGRSETVSDTITAAPVRGLSATLDLDDPSPGAMDLPPLWHWLYFLPRAKQSELGPDGHALRGGFLPPVPFPRRMWAGGRLHWSAPLRIGDEATRVSRVERIEHKHGRSGELVFVMVSHEVRNAQGLCLREEHDIVYRPLAPQHTPMPDVPSPAPPHSWARHLIPDDALLFRYSALTFNGHRIHYDRRYCQEVEGYPGLVIHGPLLATLLLDLVRRHSLRDLASLEFKAVRPCFECADQRPIHLHGQPHDDGQGVDLWAQDHEQHTTMQATALFRPH
jgi:3-methylfumaryl-CoA hydratase